MAAGKEAKCHSLVCAIEIYIEADSATINPYKTRFVKRWLNRTKFINYNENWSGEKLLTFRQMMLYRVNRMRDVVTDELHCTYILK